GWYTYDSDENTMKPPIHTVRSSGVIYDDEIHILGGNATPTEHYKWSKKTKTWIKSMSIPYSFDGGEAVVLNGEIHILGINETDHYKFDGSVWTKVSELRIPFNDNIAIVYDDEIHVIGA